MRHGSGAILCGVIRRRNADFREKKSPRLRRRRDIGVLVEQIIDGVVPGSMHALVAHGCTLAFGVLDKPNFAREIFMPGGFIAVAGAARCASPDGPRIANIEVLEARLVPVKGETCTACRSGSSIW